MLPGQIRQITEFGNLVVNSVDLNADPRWCSYRNSDLWTDRSVRGSNLLMPRRPGQRARRKRFDQTRYLLPMIVSGAVSDIGSYLGVIGAEGRCLSTLTLLETSLINPDDDSEVPIVYNAPNTTTWTSTAQVLGLRKNSYGSAIWEGNLEFILLKPWEIT